MRKKPMILRAYSPSDDDFVEDAFTDKRARGSSKADEPVSKKSKKPAVSSKPSKTAVSSKPSKPSGSSKPSKLSGSSKPSKPSGSSNPEDPKPVLSEDLKPGLNLRQTLQPNQVKFPMVEIKNFPGPLYDIINEITMDQKWAVAGLGFTSLMDFGLNVMPSRLGYWLLERFDAKSGILTVFGETIKITPERVHHNFGFPMGQLEVDVRDVLKERSNENYIEWRNQLGKKPRLFVNKDLLPLIRKQIKKNDSGKLFTMNFICLFSTILFHVVSMGTLNIAVLPSLVDLTKVRQMNWCKYVVDCMKETGKDWKSGKPFFGPILLLEKTEILGELEEMLFGKIRKGRAPKAVKTNDDDDDGAKQNIDYGEEERDDDDQEQIENAEAEIQNVEQPSTKPRWTKEIVSKRGTPEKLGLQMIIENYGDEIEEEKTEEDQIQPVIGEDEDNMLIEYTVKKRQRTLKGGKQKRKRSSLSPNNCYSMNMFKSVVGYKRKRTSNSPKAADVDEQMADNVHIDDIQEPHWVDPQPFDDDIPKTGTEDDIQRTESDPMADPMTGTDQTSENRNDELSSSSIKLTQQQLSAMILEFQGEYSQFKLAEEFSNSLKNMLSLFQEMKINIDDMLRAGLEKHPGNESLLEVQDWMNKLVNRITSKSSQKEDESSQTLMITMGDDTDGSKAKEASIETDEPQPDNPTEPTFTQLCLDPAFMEAFEKIEREQPMPRPQFPIFNPDQFQNKALVLYQEKQDPEQILDELIKNTPFMHTSSGFLSDKIDDSAWKRIQDEASEMKKTGVKRIKSSPQDEDKPKMIRPISCAPPAPEEKVTLNEVNVNEAEDEDFTTPLNSFNTIAQKLKIPETVKNISEVVVMKNKVHDNEKKVADTIFAARGDLDDVLFHSYFVDGQRIHFESFKEGNEVSAGVIDMWAYNIREKRKVKPSESIKSPYFQRVVVMKNKVHDNEKKVADTIFAARGDLDDVLFHSYFVDGQRIHFESFKEGNEVSVGVIDMWAYVLNQSERKRSTGSLRKLYCHTSIISAEMEKKSLNSKANKSKFVEEMTNLLFISVYQSIKDIDLRYLFIKYLKDNGYPHFKALDDYKVANVKMSWQTNNSYVDCGIFAMRYMEMYSGNRDFDAGFNIHAVESEIEDYHRLTLKEKKMLQDKSAKNIADRASEYFENQASALLKKMKE
ncbi:hypothetical protein CTI12_AA523920 [Artemisia annua]|uniref:Ulp1 protease family, C-terminal catalytic domain-containing protein n=1 Tax=Artemisia annua TaxID=35608 RepID=A0A2U1L5Q7_ARTAN|nr:hypothetical protein CTI12_AA523920 [Artemisia annua]